MTIVSTHKLTKSVTFNRQEDAVILRKLRRSGKFDKGAWSPFVRELCRRWAEEVIGASDVVAVGGTPAAADIRQAIVQALDERGLDLASIRQTMESAIGSVQLASGAASPEPEGSETEYWFDVLEDGAIL